MTVTSTEAFQTHMMRIEHLEDSSLNLNRTTPNGKTNSPISAHLRVVVGSAEGHGKADVLPLGSAEQWEIVMGLHPSLALNSGAVVVIGGERYRFHGESRTLTRRTAL
jgi:hypothetical protein